MFISTSTSCPEAYDIYPLDEWQIESRYFDERDEAMSDKNNEEEGDSDE